MIAETDYLQNGDLEKDVLGIFFLDNSCEFISKTKLKPEHFANEINRKMFILQKQYYLKYRKVDAIEMIKDYEHNKSVQSLITNYYSYAATYVIPSSSIFIKNEERLIKKYQRETSKKLVQQYSEGQIEYSELKNQLDEVNTNQFFKNLLEVSRDIDDFTKEHTKTREYTDIKQLDWLTKGLEYGSLNVWSGITSSGKTAMMTQLTRNFINKGKKVFYFNGEQTSREFKNNLFVTMCTKEQLDFVKDSYNESIIDVIPKREVAEHLNNKIKDKLYVYNNDIPKNDIDTMISVMDEAFRKGVRIYFIDNFMQLDNSEQLDQQTRIVEKFKRFARDRNSIVILVAHPRKLNFGTTRLNIFDISGTQNISNKATNICTIIRKDTMAESEKDFLTKYLLDNNYSIDDCDSIVEVLKTKGNKNGVVGLKFDSEQKTFKEVHKLTPDEKSRISLEVSERGKRKR